MKKSLIFILLSLLSTSLFAFEEIGEKNFMKKMETPGNKLVVFYVPEDPNSQDLNKSLHNLNPKNVTIYFIHAGKNKNLSLGMGIAYVPTTLYFKANQLKGREVGAKTQKEIEESIKEYFK